MVVVAIRLQVEVQTEEAVAGFQQIENDLAEELEHAASRLQEVQPILDCTQEGQRSRLWKWDTAGQAER